MALSLIMILTQGKELKLLISTSSANKLLSINSNQECTDISVVAMEPKLDWAIIRSPLRGLQWDGVTSFKVKHADSSVLWTLASFFPCCRSLKQGNFGIVIDKNKHSSSASEVELCIDVVLSSPGYCQLSLTVRHATCKVTTWVAGWPVVDHWKVNKMCTVQFYIVLFLLPVLCAHTLMTFYQVLF